MFEHLDIYDRRDRTLVGIADAALRLGAWPLRFLRPACSDPPKRILLLRLERIGDLLMTLGAIRAVRRLAPHAVIDLVVGSWNAEIAGTLAGIDRIEQLDAPWLVRGGRVGSSRSLAARALGWRRQHYDLAINFEGDIRSQLLMAASLACRRVGFAQGGGGPLLTDPVGHDPRQHVARNSLNLVERAFGLQPGTLASPEYALEAWRLDVPAAARERARERLSALRAASGGDRPIVAVHVSSGRAIKQWPLGRIAEAARRIGEGHGAHLVLTGSAADRAQVREVTEQLDSHVPWTDLAGEVDLLTLAAILAEVDLVITGDTGPMHLAAAVGAPIVAVFGPSDPRRYAPLAAARRIVRVDLPCAPCNRIRRPPARCTPGPPECLSQLTVDAVARAAADLLAGAPRPVLPRA